MLIREVVARHLRTDGTVWVAYNGEIYDHVMLRQQLLGARHRFTTASDTEVLVHGYEEWGIEGLLQRLRGMFAFVIVDTRAGRCLPRPSCGRLPCTRDRRRRRRARCRS